MKKIIALVLVLALAVSLLAACGQENTIGEANAAASQDDGKLRIVTTIFPEYDWVREILGDQADRADLTMLLDNGVDLHSYQPTADDIAKIADCDLFLYVGGESDEWVDDALKESANPDQKVINLMDVLSDEIKEEEHVEGMEAEEEEPISAEAEEEGPEYDEHVWLSLRNAETLCTAITNALGELDPDHKDVYTANASTYLQKLDQLDQRYQQTVDAAARNTLLFGDRFPFRYLVDDYGLTYYAAFAGCSAESEASFETSLLPGQESGRAGPALRADHRGHPAQDRRDHRAEHQEEGSEGFDHGLHAGHHVRRREGRHNLPLGHGEKSQRAERSTELRG